MSDVQLPLPGMPIRIVVSAIWESAERSCTIRATVDAPSDQFSNQIVGTDTEGSMTWEELSGAMETLLAHVMDQSVVLGIGAPSLLGSAVERMNSHLQPRPR